MEFASGRLLRSVTVSCCDPSRASCGVALERGPSLGVCLFAGVVSVFSEAASTEGCAVLLLGCCCPMSVLKALGARKVPVINRNRNRFKPHTVGHS